MPLLRLLAAMLLLPLLLQPAMAASLRIETINGPPWGFVGSDGQPTGMMYEISNRIAQEAGFSYSNALVPYARTGFDIENGHADFILRFGSEHMTRGAIAVATIVTMPVILVGPKGTRYRSLEDLHGKTVGVVRSSSYVDKFDSDSAITKYAVNDYVMMATMLSMRRLDGGVGSSAGLYYGAYMAGVPREQLGEPLVLGHNDFVLFFSKKTATPATLKALKAAVDKLTASGEIRKIVNKYNNAAENPDQVRR
jgi:ABC-type amino acid transport substrate-binding protein